MMFDLCGHSICQLCLRRYENRYCPICRQRFTKAVKNYDLCEYIELFSSAKNTPKQKIYSTIHSSLIGVEDYIISVDRLIDTIDDGLKNKVFEGHESFFFFIYQLFSIDKNNKKKIRYNIDLDQWYDILRYINAVKSNGFPSIQDQLNFEHKFEIGFECERINVLNLLKQYI
jgi:hypothetical protein